MTQKDYAMILRFLEEKGYGYAVLKKYTPDLFNDLDKRMTEEEAVRVNGDKTPKGKYYPIQMYQGKGKYKCGYNSLIVLPQYLTSEEKNQMIMVTSVSIAKKIDSKASLCVVHRMKQMKKNKALVKKYTEDAANEELSELKKAQSDAARIPTPPIPDMKKSAAERYEDFLKSDYWKYVRGKKLKDAHNKCQICGSKKSLNVHHNSYANHGQEYKHLEDLVVLCSECHKKFHNKLKD